MLRLWIDGVMILGSVTVLAVNGAHAGVATWCDALVDGVAVVMGALPWVNECGRAGFEHLTQGTSNLAREFSQASPTTRY